MFDSKSLSGYPHKSWVHIYAKTLIVGLVATDSLQIFWDITHFNILFAKLQFRTLKSHEVVSKRECTNKTPGYKNRGAKNLVDSLPHVTNGHYTVCCQFDIQTVISVYVRVYLMLARWAPTYLSVLCRPTTRHAFHAHRQLFGKVRAQVTSLTLDPTLQVTLSLEY